MRREIKEHTLFDDKFGESITIIDLGACRGEFSDGMSDHYNVKKAILIEAVPNNFNHIGRRENYSIYNRAISTVSNNKVIFYEDLKSPYNGSFLTNYFGGVAHEIPTVTIEELMTEHSLDFVDILKVDIEGAEYEILYNLDEEILNKIGQITVEFHDFLTVPKRYTSQDVINRFVSLGFQYTSNHYPGAPHIPHYDVCFYR